MPNTVDVGAVRDAGRKLGAEDGPLAYLRNVQRLLEDVKLSGMALTFLGLPTVTAHNEVVDGHLDNVRNGVAHLQRAAEQLNRTADNWERSDQPWVVR